MAKNFTKCRPGEYLLVGDRNQAAVDLVDYEVHQIPTVRDDWLPFAQVRT